jgi:DNA primase large subunit
MALDDEDVMFTVEYLAKYPFLESARQYIKSLKYLRMPFPEFLQSTTGKMALELAMYRVMRSVHDDIKSFGKKHMPDHEILSYVIARAIVSCSDPSLGAIDKLLTYEANRSIEQLRTERYTIRRKVYDELKFDVTTGTIPMVDYVPALARLATKKPEYKLVNREVQGGCVKIEANEAEEILTEKIKSIMRERMPMQLPEDARKTLEPIAKDIFGGGRPAVTFDKETPISEYPPCMETIMHDLENGLNLSHPARFAIVTFLNSVGKNEDDIITLFKRVRDFDENKTRYQVRHITGADGGTKYSAPSCATMRTNGLCISAGNKLCKKVAHPLGYFSTKTRRRQT